MPLFDDYETYRNQLYSGSDYRSDPYLGELLSQSERQLMSQMLSDSSWRHAQPDPALITSHLVHSGDGVSHLVFDDPLVDAYAKVAYARTAGHFAPWRDGPVYPDDPGVLNAYPGVDPQGRYCAKDMEFGQRLTRLMDAAALTNPQRHPTLINAFEALKNPVGPMKELLDQVQDTFSAVRETEHAAKVCPNQMTANLLESHANRLCVESECIRRLDQYYTALEHIAGLRKDQPTMEVLSTAAELGLPPALVAQSAPQTIPRALSVQFRNFDHMTEQRTFSHPANWGRHPSQLPAEPGDPQALEPYISRYAAATAHSMLHSLYHGKEDAPAAPSGNNRSTMIVVDGMTVEERMAAEHKQLRTEQPYDQWYAQNVKQKTAEYVAAGLIAGKRVEAYLPKADGSLPMEPVRLSAQGYTPSPRKPVTLNAWQSFWNKFGFYKGKAKQADEDQRSIAARERVHTHYTCAQIEKSSINRGKNMYEDVFFGDYLREKGLRSIPEFAGSLKAPSPGTQVPYLRTSYISLCVGILAAHDIPMEDIMDPNKLRQEKQAIGGMLLNRLAVDPNTGLEGIDRDSRTGDPAWLGRMYYTAHQGLLRQINRTMQGVDLKNDEQMRKAMPALNVAQYALHDIWQDVSLIPGANAVYSSLISGPEGTQNHERTQAYRHNVLRVTSGAQAIVEGYRARGALETCSNSFFPVMLGNYVTGIAVANEMANAPGNLFTQRAPTGSFVSKLTEAIMHNRESGSLADLNRAALADPKTREAIAAMAQTGDLATAMGIQTSAKEGRLTLTINPSRQILKTANAIQKATPAPQMGGR